MKRVDKTRRLCVDAALICAAFALSYAEHMIPLMPSVLPGVKPGLANIVTTVTFFALSPIDAAAISLCRVLLAGMIFGGPVSLAVSFGGAAASYLGLCAVCFMPKIKEHLSFVGISVFCAALHSAGQLCTVPVISGTGAFTYLPVMLAASCITGAINGFILNLTYPSFSGILGRYGIK